MTKPLIADTRWAVDGTDADASNVAAPPSGLRDTGYAFGAIPASSFDNYWQNRAYRWFQYLNAGALVGDHSITGSLAVGGQTLTFVDFTFTADSSTDRFAHTAHGLLTGDGPVRMANSGGALPSGLFASTDYYAVLVDADHFQLSITRSDALSGFIVDITDNGTGTQTLLHQAGTTHPADATLSRNVPIAGTVTAAGAAVGGSAVTVTSTAFTASSVSDVLDLGIAHGLQTGAGPVRVTNSGGALPVPLAAATDYWIIRSTSNKVSLATSFVNAMTGTLIDLTTTGSGTNTLVAGASPTASGSATIHGNLAVDGRLTQGVQTTVVVHMINGSNFGATGSAVSVPGTTASGQGYYMQLGSVVGRTLVAIRAYVVDDGGTARLLIGLSRNDSLAFLGSPPVTAPSDVAGTLSSPSAGSGSVELVQKTGLSIRFSPGVSYFLFCRISAGTGGLLYHMAYDWT